jgi:hypothetical protein
MMERHTKIMQLRNAIEEAIACADEAGLALVVLILEIARLEVDQSTDHTGDSMPTTEPFGKPP